MEPVNKTLWMPDSRSGGDIHFTQKERTIEIIIERGGRDWIGCTKTVKFNINLSDAAEFAQGLLAIVNKEG